jgi:hypothetical protein
VVADVLALGGPVSTTSGGWDWWVLACIPMTYLVARRIVGLQGRALAVGIALACGTVLSDVLGAWGVAPAVAAATAVTIMAVLARRTLPGQPPSV